MPRLVDEAEHLSHNQNTSVASLRLLFGFIPESCSPCLRIAVRIGRNRQERLGMLHKGFKGPANQPYVVRGILMHSSLAVTVEGLPLGLCAIKFWTRDRFKGTNAVKRTINPTRVPIEEKAGRVNDFETPGERI